MTKETLKIQIEDTRKYLNQSITEKQSADKILEISVKLDKLIEEYLNTKNKTTVRKIEWGEELKCRKSFDIAAFFEKTQT